MPKNIPAADARIVALKSLEAGSGDVSECMIITTHTNFYNTLAFSFISTYLVGIQNEQKFLFSSTSGSSQHPAELDQKKHSVVMRGVMREKRSTFKYVQSSQ